MALVAHIKLSLVSSSSVTHRLHQLPQWFRSCMDVVRLRPGHAQLEHCCGSNLVELGNHTYTDALVKGARHKEALLVWTPVKARNRLC